MAQIRTSTCSVVNGSELVVAAPGNDWSQVTTACLFTVSGDQVVYGVGAIAAPGVSESGNYEITLTSMYAGVDNNAATYAITKDFTPNMALPLISAGDIQTFVMYNRAMTILDAIFGQAIVNGAMISSPELLENVQGGTSADLDSIATIPLALRITRKVLNTAVQPYTISEWVLVAGTKPATDVASGILLPPDYNAVSNARYWQQIS